VGKEAIRANGDGPQFAGFDVVVPMLGTTRRAGGPRRWLLLILFVVAAVLASVKFAQDVLVAVR
jgi:hypothetical protein